MTVSPTTLFTKNATKTNDSGADPAMVPALVRPHLQNGRPRRRGQNKLRMT